ncbi:MAG: ATP-binding protein [Candidatus Andersenbacteria bacterium]
MLTILPKPSLLPDKQFVQRITGTVALLSFVTLVFSLYLLSIDITSTGLLLSLIIGVGFFGLYVFLPKIYMNETILMASDIAYLVLITYIASHMGEYGIFVLFLYFVIIIADGLKYPISEYSAIVLFTTQAAFFYILLGTPFPLRVRLSILAIFTFSTIATAVFVWYFASQVLSERSLRSLMEKKSSYLKTMNEHLKAVDDMRETIMHVTSHEFQAPLTRIKYALEALRDSKICNMAPEQLRLLQVAASSNERLVHMIGNLLTAARFQSEQWQLHPQNLDLVSILQELIEEYQDILTSRQQRLVVNLPRQAVYARIDPDLILIAYKNLLDNASKYTKAGGTVTISLLVQPDEVLLSVQDTGMGIAPEDFSRLFSQFYRTDEAIIAKPEGFGIGLYFSREIVRHHEGDITVASEPGKGSTFTIHLPKKILLSYHKGIHPSRATT